jgi:hypothetical protein
MAGIMDGNEREVSSTEAFAASGTDLARYLAIKRTIVNKRSSSKLLL